MIKHDLYNSGENRAEDKTNPYQPYLQTNPYCISDQDAVGVHWVLQNGGLHNNLSVSHFQRGNYW